MIGAPFELSAKLDALGCESGSEEYFSGIEASCLKFKSIIDYSKEIREDPYFFGSICRKYFCEDFIGPTERAIKNCKILFGDYSGYAVIFRDGNTMLQTIIPASNYNRHKLVDMQSEEEFWEYIKRAVNTFPSKYFIGKNNLK